MSTIFMLTIALLYASAAVCYFIDGDWRLGVVAACWGVGNAILAGIR